MTNIRQYHGLLSWIRAFKALFLYIMINYRISQLRQILMLRYKILRTALNWGFGACEIGAAVLFIGMIRNTYFTYALLHLLQEFTFKLLFCCACCSYWFWWWLLHFLYGSTDFIFKLSKFYFVFKDVSIVHIMPDRIFLALGLESIFEFLCGQRKLI